MAGPLGSAPGIILAAGLGAAASTALEPIVEPARQQAWENNPYRILDPALYAALVAQGAVDLTTGQGLAKRHGLDKDPWEALVYLAQRAPTYAEAQDLRRRGKITRDQLFHAFAKEQIEAQYWEALADLVDERLSPQVMALAIVRGLVEDPGILPVGPPSQVGNVPAFPVFDVNPVTESAASGIDKERLSILAGIAGRPLAPDAAAQAYFRGILQLADFQRAISEGDIRNEWADALLQHARQIPSVSDYVNAHIRGWINETEMHNGAARHGMSPADTDLLYLRTGRPATPHQVLIGLRRGASRGGSVANVPEDIQTSVKQSDIRPEWTEIEYAAALTYPSGFMIRGAVQSGDLTPAQAKQLLYEMGWRESWIDIFVEAWAKPAATTAKENPWLAKAQQRFWTDSQNAYIKDNQTRAVIEPFMENFVPDQTTRDLIFQWWDNTKIVNGTAPATPIGA